MNIASSSLIAFTAWLIMLGQARYRQLPFCARLAYAMVLIGVAAKGLARVAVMAASNIRHPPEWDFLIFWIDGIAASRGLNFYDPNLAARLAAPFHPSAGFVEAALAVPFLYPPPSIIWFVPLGWLDIHTAAVVWYAGQLACLIGSIAILSRTFFETLSALNVTFVTSLVFMIHGTYWNVANAQTVFLLLFFLSLAFHYRNSTWGGVWLAFAILVKPFVAVLILYAVLRREWRPLAGTVATVLVATVACLTVFGRAVFASYAATPFSSLPRSMFTELENQSLLAWILRLTHSPDRFPVLFAILAALFAAILLWRLSTRRQTNEAACFVLALTFGLLLYPASLRSYTVILILPILVLYSARLWIPIALAYGLMFVGQGDYVVLATLTIGLTLAIRMPSRSAEACETAKSLPRTDSVKVAGRRREILRSLAAWIGSPG